MSAREEQLEAQVAYLKEQIDALTNVAAIPAIRAALRITDRQARMLAILTRRANMLTTHDSLYRAMFEGENGDGPQGHIVSVYLCHVRAALRDAKAPGKIHTVWGDGWKADKALCDWVRSIVRGDEDQQVAA